MYIARTLCRLPTCFLLPHFLTFKKTVMQPKPAFPTNPCRSRQIANIFFLIAFSMSFSLRGFAQAAGDKPVYFSVTYLKVLPGKDGKYQDLVKKYGHKLNQYFLKEGAILGWYLHEVIVPSGSAREYDYAAVNVSTNFPELLDDTISIAGVIKKVFPGTTNKMVDSIFAQYGQARTVVKREIYTGVSQLNMDAPTTKYVTLAFMKPTPGKEADYVKMEKEVWLPIHKARMELGVIKDWGLYEKILPYDTRSDFNYVTTEFYDDLNSVVNSKYIEAFSKAWPGQDANKIGQNAEDLRKMVRSEIWKVIDYVDKSNTK